MPNETDTRHLIDNNLQNLGWQFTGKGKNVFFEQPRNDEERKKLNGKRPDYVLYSEENRIPLIVIEAKKPGERIDKALEQGIFYARALEAPLVYATDGVFCKSFHTGANRTPQLNGEDVDEFIREALALKFLETWEINTISPKVQYDRQELIKIFDEANNMLRGDGLRAGIERFGEFANILFLKLISETEDNKKMLGLKTDFDDVCHWDHIKALKPNARIEHINKIVYDKLNLLYGTEIFTSLLIKDSDILDNIIKKLDPLTLIDVDSDIKGDAFEYFLKESTSTKNDLGEYFTPRHIVKTMIKLVNPQIGEKIYDPFCGTGGFLIESFRYIHNNMSRNPNTEEILRNETIYGNEITNTARITKMNMILAGDGHSNIHMKDSLANPVEGEYDVVITNMPYSQKTNHGNLYDLPSNNGDSICVQHCMKAINSLSENGRMALVVPEGFLFRKDLSKAREYLLKNCQLQSIISLPQGVFLPYTGVKTDIIYATKVNQKLKSSEKRKDFWYFDVKNDGYTLDNHRRKLETTSDLSKYEEYRKLDNDQASDMMKVGFEIIPFDKVRKNSFVLVGSRYRKSITTVSDSIRTIQLGNVADFVRGIAFPKAAQRIEPDDNSLKIVTTRAAQSDGIDFSNIIYIDSKYIKKEKLISQGDILISLANSLDLVGRVTYVDKNYKNLSFGAFMGLIRVDRTKVYPAYLFDVLQSQKARDYFKCVAKTTTNISNLTFDDLSNFLLPLPSLETQIKIASECEGYRQVITGAKTIIENYKPKIQIKESWTVKKLSALCDINISAIDPVKAYGGNSFIYVDISSIENDTGKIDINNIIIGNNAPSRARRVFKKGDILMSTVRPNLKAFGYVDFEPQNCVASTGFAVLSPTNIDGKYLYYMLFDDYVGKQLANAMGKGMYPSVNKHDLEYLDIPLPSLETQEQIVKQIESEKALIEPSKQLIEVFTQKIRNKISEVWGEKA
jgi:type I restriction enzyme M protein